MLLTVMVASAVVGCSGKRDPSEVLGVSEAGTIVVDAALMVGRTLPDLRLSRTTDPDKPYSVFGSGIVGASVEIRRGATVFTYLEYPDDPGFYFSDQFHIVQPESVYELRVITAEGEVVTAQTLTPPDFQVENWALLENDGVTLRKELNPLESEWFEPENYLTHADGLFEAQFLRPDVPGFQVAIYSLDEGSDFVIDVSFLDPEDLDEFKRENSSPIIVGDDGKLRLPWFAIAFEGRYRLEIFAVDNNWYDLVRSFPELNGGGGFGFGGNAGDNFDKPLFHIEGGIGLFGSGARDEIGFTIFPPGS
jgi:hypothetical protein